jgi:diguanylate cyclase (GGDEF)-like protein
LSNYINQSVFNKDNRLEGIIVLKQNNISYKKLLEIIELQTEVVQQGMDLGCIMNLVVQRAQIITHADGACIELVAKEQLVYSAVSGLAKKFLGLRLFMENSLSGECIKRGEILVSNDIEDDNRANKIACRQIGLSSMIVVPLAFREEVVGVLKVMSAKTDHFQEESINILGLISELIAAAMFSALKNEESEVFHKATHDFLTGVSNRSLFYDRLRQRLSQAKRKSETFGIIMMDMDGLKGINDNYGHRTGDAAIKEVALRIKDSLRESDTVSRLGGDEFGVIAVDGGDCNNLSMLIQRIYSEISKPFVFEGHKLELKISAGYSLFSQDGSELEALIEKADQSMYEAKRIRKGLAVS